VEKHQGTKHCAVQYCTAAQDSTVQNSTLLVEKKPPSSTVLGGGAELFGLCERGFEREIRFSRYFACVLRCLVWRCSYLHLFLYSVCPKHRHKALDNHPLHVVELTTQEHEILEVSVASSLAYLSKETNNIHCALSLSALTKAGILNLPVLKGSTEYTGEGVVALFLYRLSLVATQSQFIFLWRLTRAGLHYSISLLYILRNWNNSNVSSHFIYLLTGKIEVLLITSRHPRCRSVFLPKIPW
jgi:hypothetical protein